MPLYRNTKTALLFADAPPKAPSGLAAAADGEVANIPPAFIGVDGVSPQVNGDAARKGADFEFGL